MTLLSFGPYVTLDGERTGWPSLYGADRRGPGHRRRAADPVRAGAHPADRRAAGLRRRRGRRSGPRLGPGRRAGARHRGPAADHAACRSPPPIAPPVPDVHHDRRLAAVRARGRRHRAGAAADPAASQTRCAGRPPPTRRSASPRASSSVRTARRASPRIGIYPRPTSQLLAEVAKTGDDPADHRRGPRAGPRGPRLLGRRLRRAGPRPQRDGTAHDPGAAARPGPAHRRHLDLADRPPSAPAASPDRGRRAGHRRRDVGERRHGAGAAHPARPPRGAGTARASSPPPPGSCG